MPNIGPMEVIVVLAIALMVLGPKRLPQAGKSLGAGSASSRARSPRPRRARGRDEA
jgi:TatA/E family protein of Tat protein translocase